MRLSEEIRLEIEAETQDLIRDSVDVTMPGRPQKSGDCTRLPEHSRLNRLFASMGYAVATGPEIEDDWHNFEALNIHHITRLVPCMIRFILMMGAS